MGNCVVCPGSEVSEEKTTGEEGQVQGPFSACPQLVPVSESCEVLLSVVSSPTGSGM